MEISPTVSSITVPVIQITNSANFNYFFTLIFVFGAVAYYSSVFIRIIRSGHRAN